ncbi:MAG: hypothetical protein OEW15_11415 [Nitrospirota bacterium]|nr:hypothetical protein [Nitrospirota bacterium]
MSGRIRGSYAQKLSNCWRCDFMNMVKKEEEPTAHGFSATKLGMERAIEKQRMVPVTPSAQAARINSDH